MLLDKLKSIVGEKGWSTDADELEPHLTEWRDRFRGETLIMVSPNTTAQVSQVVKACAGEGVGIVPQGGNTGLCGGAIPDESGQQVLLSLSRLNAIRTIDENDFSIVVEAGCILSDVHEAARDHGRFFPLSLGAEGSCQIGGNLSTNAGGINVLRYGTARQQVLGLEVVLADGSVWDGLRSLRKDTAGYDMKQVFLGSEGTLGVITAATLKLYPEPGQSVTLFAALDSAQQSIQLLARMREAFSDRIQAFELISDRCLRFVAQHIPGSALPFAENYPWFVLSEVVVDDQAGIVEDMLGTALDEHLVVDAIIAKNDAEASRLWRLRHSISEAQKPEGANLKHDIAVPIGRIGDFLMQGNDLVAAMMPTARPVVFGHVGDGNLHYNIAQPPGADGAEFLQQGTAMTEAIYGLVTEMGGSISAEHGIGVLKKAHLRRYRSAAELGLMRTLKSALDPQNVLNPGKVI
jgi:FAD/FMN-containing dehydrogenase